MIVHGLNILTFFNIQQVEQRDVPGIDNAFLAMDTEEGVEVVWNEVQFSGNRNLKEQQVTIDLDHYFSWTLSQTVYGFKGPRKIST